MATKEILDVCADMVVMCDDGTTIPCSQYNIMSLCGLVRCVVENAPLLVDSKGRKIFPFPGVSSSILVTTFNLLHGLLSPGCMTKQQCLDALEGMDLLESSGLRMFVLDRLLALAIVSTGTDDSIDILPPLIETQTHRLAALTIALRTLPLWTLFRRMLARIRMTNELAQWMMTRTVRTFSASVVFCELMSLVPESVLTLDDLLETYSMRGFGVHHHPVEVTMSLAFLQKIIEDRGWADDARHVLGMISTIRDSLLVYDAAPLISSSVYGSILIFENTPIVSCMLTIDGRIMAPKRLCLSPWLSVVLDLQAGSVTARLKPGKIDAIARHSKSIRVHMTGLAWRQPTTPSGQPKVIVDAWFSFDNVTPGSTLTLASNAPSRGDPDSVGEGLRSRGMNYLRFDVHYGVIDVLN